LKTALAINGVYYRIRISKSSDKKKKQVVRIFTKRNYFTDSVLLYKVSIVAHDKGDDIYEASDEFTRY
jgi:hypothetical protein